MVDNMGSSGAVRNVVSGMGRSTLGLTRFGLALAGNQASTRPGTAKHGLLNQVGRTCHDSLER